MDQYKVMRCYTYGWDNGFFSDDEGETPTLFDSIKEAEDEIQDHLRSIEYAISKGYMTEDSRESKEDFKIVHIHEGR